MNEKSLHEVASAFADYTPGLPKHDTGRMTITPLTGGLINHTWLIRCELKPSFLLQQINTNVFPRPEDVQHNYISISNYAEFEMTGLRLPYPQYLNDDESLFIDAHNNYWRAFEFIDNAYSPPLAERPSQVVATAKTFANFTAAFRGFNTDQLKIVIPDFHNLLFRYFQLEESLNGELYERMAIAMPLVEELLKRERYKNFYEDIAESPDRFPLRVMHHDAKIANVLFSKKTGKVVCPVDFDTVMPGYYFSDIGDMIRSMACSLDENSTDFDNLHIRADFYKAIIEGYLGIKNQFLTKTEIKHIHYAGLLMIYMQALRYMTDYLNGDIYYRITYPDQNFDRSKNQLILLQQLEKFLAKEFKFKA
jgi:thiamine kinase-like enzyme